VLGDVSIEYCFNNTSSCLSLLLVRHVLHQIALFEVEQDVESGSQVVVLEHTCIAVTDGKWMLGAHNELIRKARMFVVMDQARNEK